MQPLAIPGSGRGLGSGSRSPRSPASPRAGPALLSHTPPIVNMDMEVVSPTNVAPERQFTRELQDLNDESRHIWDQNAVEWDNAMGDHGNSFHRHLVSPSAMRLLGGEEGLRGKQILEIACGNGLFARKLVKFGATVVATDYATRMIDMARSRTNEQEAKAIAYRKLDVTSATELRELAEKSKIHNGFDAVIGNMALMDIPHIETFAQYLPAFLKPNGIFVFTIMHPCFNMPHSARHVSYSENPETGRWDKKYTISLEKYLKLPTSRGEAVPNQPLVQYYFHRPLHELLNVFFAEGLVMDSMEEPSFVEQRRGIMNESSWSNYSQIPPVLAVRLRKIHKVPS